MWDEVTVECSKFLNVISRNGCQQKKIKFKSFMNRPELHLTIQSALFQHSIVVLPFASNLADPLTKISRKL